MRLRISCSPLEPLVVLVLLSASFGWAGLYAQSIRIALVDGRTGRPMANSFVNTWVGTERKDAMSIPTDQDGVAGLFLTDKDSEVNTRSGDRGIAHPVVKYADTSRVVAGYVVCQPHAPDHSWLATMEFSTKQIV
jgi:hypothetical protein